MSFQLASIIGFALVFLGVAAATSAVAALVWHAARARLATRGPQAERAAAAAVLVLPLVVALAATLPLIAHALVSLGHRDHCLRMGTLLHFCFRHGAGWAQSAIAIAGVAMLGGACAVRIGRGIIAARDARSHLRVIDDSSSPMEGQPADVRLVRSNLRFCFLSGRSRPVIYVSTTAWEALDARERAAMLAHERAHARQGDLARGRWLLVAAAFGAPRLATRAMRAWSEATERLCDAHAARTVGDVSIVASAILTLASGRLSSLVGASSFVDPQDDVSGRIEAVLRGGPLGEEVAHELWYGAWRLSLLLVLASLVFYDQIQGVCEQALTWLS